jgi:hypothetical protein
MNEDDELHSFKNEKKMMSFSVLMTNTAKIVVSIAVEQQLLICRHSVCIQGIDNNECIMVFRYSFLMKLDICTYCQCNVPWVFWFYTGVEFTDPTGKRKVQRQQRREVYHSTRMMCICDTSSIMPFRRPSTTTTAPESETKLLLQWLFLCKKRASATANGSL